MTVISADRNYFGEKSVNSMRQHRMARVIAGWQELENCNVSADQLNSMEM